MPLAKPAPRKTSPVTLPSNEVDETGCVKSNALFLDYEEGAIFNFVCLSF
jgi:hypothetical protein